MKKDDNGIRASLESNVRSPLARKAQLDGFNGFFLAPRLLSWTQCMKVYSALLGIVRPACILVLGVFCLSAAAGSSTRTNWVDRAITNQIEIRMPRNVFVNEYLTNWVDVIKTNVLTVRETNHVVRWVTNHHIVLAARTNYIENYRTNWGTRKERKEIIVERFHTNFVTEFRTNWITRYETNEIAVNQSRTELVTQYLTNWQVLHVTNWQTVIAMRTNWITQPITNVVQIDLPTQPAVSRPGNPASTPRRVQPSPTPAAALAVPPDEPVIEGGRTSLPPGKSKAEVQMRVHWPADIADPLPVRQWKIESENGAFLCYGQDQVFKRELPLGIYRVEADLYREVDSAALVLRGRLIVAGGEATVQPQTAGKRVASAAPF